MADFEDVFDFIDVGFADLADMDEAVDIVFEFNEGAERGDFGDFSCDDVADFKVVADLGPGVFVELFHAEGDALLA